MAEKILIVDDELFIRRLLSEILKKGGYEIIGEAVDGKEAIEKYRSLKPDLVTMDILMPKRDGIGGIEAVREIIKEDKEAKILMVSALGQYSLVVESIEAGAKDFVTKPFYSARVLEAVKRVLKK